MRKINVTHYGPDPNSKPTSNVFLQVGPPNSFGLLLSFELGLQTPLGFGLHLD